MHFAHPMNNITIFGTIIGEFEILFKKKKKIIDLENIAKLTYGTTKLS